MIRVLVIVGTRPEAIKMAPIVLAARQPDSAIEPLVGLTGQHPTIAADALGVFGIEADFALPPTPHGGDLCTQTGAMIQAIGKVIDAHGPDVVLVQGDTLSAYAGGLAAALRRVTVGHVEAGLRSGNLDDPFPEELARRQLTHLSRLHFAPTVRAVDNLRAEGVHPNRVHLVGNTVIDALHRMRSRVGNERDEAFTVLVTAHRRENWGTRMDRICAAVAALARRNTSWRFVFSLHPNPVLQRQVRAALDSCKPVRFVVSTAYDQWVRRLVRCSMILTDSGGMQEEGCALGRPVLVLRDVTERPEAVSAGSALLVGTDPRRIVAQAERIAHDAVLYRRMATPRTLFGDGHAGRRIVRIITRRHQPRNVVPVSGGVAVGDVAPTFHG